MKLTIKKGRHRARISFGLWLNKEVLRKVVTFTGSCRYAIERKDMEDTNKLFGIGYFPGHHKESARFGWRYVPREDKIMLSAYCYVNGKRIIKDLCLVEIGKPVLLTLSVGAVHYFFDVQSNAAGVPVGSCMIRKNHSKNISYPLGLYFGGNQVAPKNMTVEMKSV